MGRGLQLLALLALPGAIWAGEINHSESEAILIFVASLIAFAIGTLLTRSAPKV